ncbi:MAG: glycoside hydrolase [Anaerolineales bacterium]|nr:glycoside hydrolase [Anaerolineales bacterium]
MRHAVVIFTVLLISTVAGCSGSQARLAPVAPAPTAPAPAQSEQAVQLLTAATAVPLQLATAASTPCADGVKAEEGGQATGACALPMGLALATIAVEPAPQDRQVSIWALNVGESERETLEANKDLIREVNFVWYTLGMGGRIDGWVADEAALALVRKLGMRVVPSIANAGFNRDFVVDAIGTPEHRTEHVQKLVSLVVDSQYDGIDIDYESLAPADRELFTLFIEELATALHAQDKLLSIAVHAKTDDAGSWDGPAAQDWARLGAAVDEFKIMTYDFHYSGGEAGPIAPLDWIDEVLTYAATVVPPEKTYVGLHFYGYDWGGGTGEGLVWSEATARAVANDATIQRDESGEAWFQYDDGQHTVYFADAENLRTKLPAIFAKHPDLAGVAIWRLGGEDPQNWGALRAVSKP